MRTFNILRLIEHLPLGCNLDEIAPGEYQTWDDSAISESISNKTPLIPPQTLISHFSFLTKSTIAMQYWTDLFSTFFLNMPPLTDRGILGSSDPESQMTAQWTNPGDIFSLLLLIGGDIVQKALAQLVGVRIPLSKKEDGVGIPLTPVAFSFGWVAYAFASLKDIVGDGALMPETDVSSQLINCQTGYVRSNRSWILGRVLRDHEKRTPVDRGKISIRIDIFEGVDKNRPEIDILWWSSWGVILIQQLIAMIPWILYGDWSMLLISLCGTIGALATGMMPQWTKEKWASRRLDTKKEKITALTRGNGHAHVMLFINKNFGWDVEAMASSSGEAEPETRYLSVVLTIWWTLLLITCSGLKEHTWYLIGVGGLGMLQNIYVAGASRKAGAFNFHYKHHSEIVGRRIPKAKIQEPENSDAEDIEDPLGKIGGVMGALMETERRFPGAGASLVSIFFPANLGYDEGKFPFVRERKFWKYAYKTMKQRRKQKEELKGLNEKSVNGEADTGDGKQTQAGPVTEVTDNKGN